MRPCAYLEPAGILAVDNLGLSEELLLLIVIDARSGPVRKDVHLC